MTWIALINEFYPSRDWTTIAAPLGDGASLFRLTHLYEGTSVGGASVRIRSQNPSPFPQPFEFRQFWPSQEPRLFVLECPPNTTTWEVAVRMDRESALIPGANWRIRLERWDAAIAPPGSGVNLQPILDAIAALPTTAPTAPALYRPFLTVGGIVIHV